MLDVLTLVMEDTPLRRGDAGEIGLHPGQSVWRKRREKEVPRGTRHRYLDSRKAAERNASSKAYHAAAGRLCCIVNHPNPVVRPMKRQPLDERRGAGRPINGSTRPCPACERGVLEFNERYRIWTARGRVTAMPAWICDACGGRMPARADHHPGQLRAASKALRARASRQLMKSRDVRARASRSLGKSTSRKKRG